MTVIIHQGYRKGINTEFCSSGVQVKGKHEHCGSPSGVTAMAFLRSIKSSIDAGTSGIVTSSAERQLKDIMDRNKAETITDLRNIVDSP